MEFAFNFINERKYSFSQPVPRGFKIKYKLVKDVAHMGQITNPIYKPEGKSYFVDLGTDGKILNYIQK